MPFSCEYPLNMIYIYIYIYMLKNKEAGSWLNIAIHTNS